jgi:glycosyltransferase involved in cell wall biosynthesis
LIDCGPPCLWWSCGKFPSRGYPPKLIKGVEVSSDFAFLPQIGDASEIIEWSREELSETVENVRRAAASLQVDDRLMLPGGVAKRDVAGWLNAGDVFLNTAEVDNTPVSVIEAMAAGRPLVASKVGGLAEIIDDGINGLLVQPRNPEALARGLKRVIENPSLATRLGRVGRERYRSQFTLDNRTSGLVAIYRQMLDRRMKAEEGTR